MYMFNYKMNICYMSVQLKKKKKKKMADSSILTKLAYCQIMKIHNQMWFINMALRDLSCAVFTSWPKALLLNTWLLTNCSEVTLLKANNQMKIHNQMWVINMALKRFILCSFHFMAKSFAAHYLVVNQLLRSHTTESIYRQLFLRQTPLA